MAEQRKHQPFEYDPIDGADAAQAPAPAPRGADAGPQMTERRLLELELIADGDADLDLKEACIEIRRCRDHIARLMAATPAQAERARLDDLRASMAVGREAIERAERQLLQMLPGGVRV